MRMARTLDNISCFSIDQKTSSIHEFLELSKSAKFLRISLRGDTGTRTCQVI